jgi:hypothetical protein
MHGECILSCNSTIYWVDFRRPLKKHLAIWQTILKDHIIPILDRTAIQWYPHLKPTFMHTFFHSIHDNQLHQYIPEGYLVYLPKRQSASNTVLTYQSHTTLSFPDQHILSSLQVAEVSHDPEQINKAPRSHTRTHRIQDTTTADTTL